MKIKKMLNKTLPFSGQNKMQSRTQINQLNSKKKKKKSFRQPAKTYLIFFILSYNANKANK